MPIARLALTFAASMALAAPALAQDRPSPVTDAEGRVFDAMPAPPAPPAPPRMAPPRMAPPAATAPRDARGVDTRPIWREDRQPRQDQGGNHHAHQGHHAAPQGGYGDAYAADYGRQRDEWLVECRRRLGSRDRGTGGALLGGVIGGVAGNRIAGRGNRTVGTIAGAAIGAVAGAAIDRAEDRGRIRDECETYLDRYTQPAYGHGYGPQGGAYPAYGYGYMVPMMMVPVAQQARNCTETIVTEEWVTVPVRQRRVTARRVVRDKRIRIVPDKRLRMD